jgi:lipoprotein-anchoring transpeptidase ErfK/SrfK
MFNQFFHLAPRRFVLGAILTTSLLGGLILPAPIVQPAQAQTAETLRNSNRRWIQVDLSSQRLIAWEGNKQVHAVIVSTGKAATPTQTGVFAVQSKHRFAQMTGEDYNVPDVPFVMYYSGSYAIHGAYWHHRFGTPVSHGCINVAVDHAEWLYTWASVGTPVVVQL